MRKKLVSLTPKCRFCSTRYRYYNVETNGKNISGICCARMLKSSPKKGGVHKVNNLVFCIITDKPAEHYRFEANSYDLLIAAGVLMSLIRGLTPGDLATTLKELEKS